jgi:hypothetical protein
MADLYGWIFFISGVIFFLSIIGLLISATKDNEKLVKKFGIIFITLLAPIFIVFINYLLIGSNLRILIYMILIIAYLIIELFLDFIFKIDFRTKPSTHVPYIILEYAACFAFVVISFDIDGVMGWAISICFWMLLGTLIYYIAKEKKK